MTLSNEDKTEIVLQHIRNLEYNKYNLSLSLLEENSVTDPNESVVKSLQAQINDVDTKLGILQTELEKNK